MRAPLLLRFSSAVFLTAVLGLLFAACGARTGDWGEGIGGSSGACATFGDPCATAACCTDLLCKQGLCKPEFLCRPQGDACEQTLDCCDFDCLNGFCGGFKCKSPGEPCQGAE